MCLRPEHWEAPTNVEPAVVMVPAPHPNAWEGCVMKTGARRKNSLQYRGWTYMGGSGPGFYHHKILGA